MYEQTLNQAGLTPNQAKIFELLLKTGEDTAGNIAKISPLKRTFTYKVLGELVELGLVAKTEKPRAVARFAPNHPLKLRDLVERREGEFREAQRSLLSLLPALTSDFQLVSGKPGTQFFEGVEGIKKVYEDTLVEQGTIYAIVATEKPEKSLGEWLRKTYVTKRIAKGNKAFVIASNAPEATEYQQLDAEELRETVIVPKDEFPFEIEIDIYATNKVAFISYNEKELIGVIVTSPAIHNTMKAFFDLAWRQSKNAGKDYAARKNSDESLPSSPPSPTTEGASDTLRKV